MIGGAIQMAEASQAIEVAEEEMRKFKKQVDKYTDKVSDYMTEITKTTVYISAIDHTLGQIRDDIRTMKQHRQLVSELQGKTRKAVHLLSVLSGKVNVFERQTRRFILQESVMEVMEEVMHPAEEIAENELLCNGGMSRLVDKMRKNVRHLRAIRASRNSDEDGSFLLKYM